MRSIRRFIIDDQGTDVLEYALLAGLISLACAATLTSVGTNFGALYGNIRDKIAGMKITP